MGRLHGIIIDGASGESIDAKIHVLSSNGRFMHPADALLKQGPGTPFFFADREFDLEVPRGRTDVVVERGTEYEPARAVADVPEHGTAEVELTLRRWHHPQTEGWYPGNTHIHYDEHETRPDDRLGIDCSVEGYNVTVVSVLDRRQRPYASNKYPIGVMNEFTTAHHVLDIGEENRHYGERSPWGMGYGHVMFLNIRNIVQPVSRGHILTAQFDPDYPPLCVCCDDAREQGGLVIWCHNGRGMEAPVAAALGKLDAFNLFDPFWMDPEYDLWYRLLNCGLRLPASTGTDWFVCSNNRVYVHTAEDFSYGAWIEGMKSGRTFITNGPSIDLSVDGVPIGGIANLAQGEGAVAVEVRYRSHLSVDRVELVGNGSIIHRWDTRDNPREGRLHHEVRVAGDGWIAARLWGDARDSFDQSVYAHTSPVFLATGRPNPARGADAAYFVRSIDQSLEWIDTWGRYNTDRQRNEVKELFRRAHDVFSGLA